jgi:lipopolysaccharide export system protein LptA
MPAHRRPSKQASIHRHGALTVARLAAALLGLTVGASHAERADRNRPMTLESDQPCTVNLIKQTSQCSGKVVVTQGTLMLRAERLELRETPDGYQVATAVGSDDAPAHYRQKRDGVDEFVEGSALRIVYDAKAGTLRFEGDATARRLAGSRTMDEIHGRVIVWDAVAEQFSVEGGAATNANPGGRVRAVIAPREPAASAPPALALPLQPSPALGERR